MPAAMEQTVQCVCAVDEHKAYCHRLSCSLFDNDLLVSEKIYRGKNWRITRLNAKPSDSGLECNDVQLLKQHTVFTYRQLYCNSNVYFCLERNVSLLTSLHLPSVLF